MLNSTNCETFHRLQGAFIVPVGQVAKAGEKHVSLFKALAAATQSRMGDLNAQDLSSTAWAFAKVCKKEASLFAALATASQLRMGDFNRQGLTNTA